MVRRLGAANRGPRAGHPARRSSDQAVSQRRMAGPAGRLGRVAAGPGPRRRPHRSAWPPAGSPIRSWATRSCGSSGSRRRIGSTGAPSGPTPPSPAEERVALVFDGLDTLAEVRLNGELLGSADNMFRTWRWDVTGRLAAGDNEVAVLFRSAVRRGAELERRPAARPAQGDAPRRSVPAQGALPLRLGLGPEAAERRHLAGRAHRGLERRPAGGRSDRAGGRGRTRPGEPARQGRGRTDGRLQPPGDRGAPAGRPSERSNRCRRGRHSRRGVGRQPRPRDRRTASCGGPTGWAASRSTGSKSSWSAGDRTLDVRTLPGRPANARASAPARRVGRVVHLRRERRARLRQGLQLDPGRLVPGPGDRRSGSRRCWARRRPPTTT